MINLPDDASPLYERVKDYILQNISDGTWPRNYRLPSENEFVTKMGVSRMTVHRALRELTAAGFLKRLQGVGTFVRRPEPQSSLLEINNIAGEIEDRGNRHSSQVISLKHVTTNPELTEQFEFNTKRKVFHSIVVHYEDEVPVQLEERFVNPALVPNYGDQDFSLGTTYDYLMNATPVSELEHLISAVPADAFVAKHLHVTPGVPCLLLRRRTWSGANVATVNRLTYVGDRYSLGTRYRPGSST